jgi:hypothetical protein
MRVRIFRNLLITFASATTALSSYGTETASRVYVTNLRILQTSGPLGAVVLAQTDGFPFGGVSETRSGFSVFPPTTWSPDSNQHVAGTFVGLTNFRQSGDASTYASIGPAQLSAKAVSDPIGTSSYAASQTATACSSCTNLMLGAGSSAVISFNLSALSEVSTFATSAYTWSRAYLEITGSEPRQALNVMTCASITPAYSCGSTGSEIAGIYSFTLQSSTASSQNYKLSFSTSAYAGGLATQVPEPSTLAMLALGLSVLWVARSRQLRKASFRSYTSNAA